MKAIYNYLYYHLYSLISVVRRFNARESAILYLSAIIAFLTMPFISSLLSKLLSGSYRLLFILLLGVYCALIVYLNKKYFEKGERIKKIVHQFKNESILQRRVGYGVVVLAFLFSIAAFFIFLSLM
ncbi:MAG TPA: hypothetical protein VFN30_07100 [Chitinophagaceae bacterium]|nr:hypothetical protein [Chitinophagaceae bacterium]